MHLARRAEEGRHVRAVGAAVGAAAGGVAGVDWVGGCGGGDLQRGRLAYEVSKGIGTDERDGDGGCYGGGDGGVACRKEICGR